MKNLLFLFLAATANAATLPLYIDTTANTVVSPDAPTTLAGYGITDGGMVNSQGLDYFLIGDGTFGYAQKKEGDAQDALGIIGLNGGGQIGTSATTTYGGAVGFNATSTTGFAGGISSTTGSGVSVGNGSTSTDGFAFGFDAIADGPGRGQLGEGENFTNNTIQYRDSGSVTALQFGKLASPIVTQTVNRFSLDTDSVILTTDTMSGSIKVSLISAASVWSGYTLSIKNTGASTQTVIDADGIETIDGELSITLTIQYESVTLITDGSNWFIL